MYGHTKKEYGPALLAKDPDQENNNEGARPVMQATIKYLVWIRHSRQWNQLR